MRKLVAKLRSVSQNTADHRPGPLAGSRLSGGTTMVATGAALLVVSAVVLAVATLRGGASTSLEEIFAVIVLIGAVLYGWGVGRYVHEHRTA